MRNLLSAFVLLSGTTLAFASDLVVGPDAEYETIQSAVDDASAGDRILIQPGVYTEMVFVPFDRRGLQFVGRGAVWDGTVGGILGTCLEIEADDVVVTGIRFRNGAQHVSVAGDDVRVTKCSFRNAMGPAFWSRGAGARVESCTFAGVGTAAYFFGADSVMRRNDVRGAAHGGVFVQAENVLVERNTFRTIGGERCVGIEGPDARVLSNTATNVEFGIQLLSDGAEVRGNRIGGARSGGIHVQGYRVTVGSNRVAGCGATAIYVEGDRYEITGNTVADVIGDVHPLESDGIRAFSASESAGGVLEDNSVADVCGVGIFVYGGSVDVRANVASRCGTLSGAGFFLVGRSLEVEGNLSLDAGDTAFGIDGTTIVLRANVARDAGGDGFQVSGDRNELAENVALRCGGEGLHNAGTATDVSRCRFLKNRIDVTCAHGEGASFSDFRDNVYVTGDEDREPEVDFPSDFK